MEMTAQSTALPALVTCDRGMELDPDEAEEHASSIIKCCELGQTFSSETYAKLKYLMLFSPHF